MRYSGTDSPILSNYFDDYPIESVVRGNYVVPIRKGRGVIETSILPISNEFYTQKRFQ